MIGNLKQRFLIYPIAWTVVGFFIIYNYYPDVLDNIPQFEGIDSNIVLGILLYFVGYLYGTLSVIIRATHFTGIFSLTVIFVLKVFIVIKFMWLGFIFLIVEIIAIPFIFEHKRRKAKENAITDEKTKNDLLKMLLDEMKKAENTNKTKKEV